MLSNLLIVLPVLVTISFAIFLVSLLFFYLSGFISLMFGAPYISLSHKYIRKILSFGNLFANDTFYDFGCGDGRILISGVSDFNVLKAVGYEIAPWPYFKTLFSIKLNRLKKINVFRKNFLKADIGEATFIYLYLFIKLVDKVAYKIAKEGTPGTKILCVQFPIDINKHAEFELLKSTQIDNLTIYLYKLIPRDSFK